MLPVGLSGYIVTVVHIGSLKQTMLLGCKRGDRTCWAFSSLDRFDDNQNEGC